MDFRAAVAALFLAVQVAVPLVQLGAPRPARFGWQMFAGIRPPPRFATVSADGVVEPVTLEDFVAVPRPDVDLTDDRLPAHICAAMPGIRAVRVEHDGAVSERPC